MIATEVKILVVEDENIVAMDIKCMLMKLGYDVLGVVSNGEHAVKQAEIMSPDLILMDIIIKGSIDGIEAACRIRTKFKIPIIFLTAHSDQKTRQRAKMAEPNGYLLKPFHEAELDQVIKLSLGPKAN
ncbi:two-component system response regulator [candidate division KSB1 bacterium RBG_16_48_16]|nr:MAG: two-component system response regulator [candidate division KSB1 bacterium RBG_16_48_16]